jgi:beta-lactamase superfamily II metal-dependent hydrolase
MRIRNRILSLALAVLSLGLVLTWAQGRAQWPFERSSASPLSVEVLDVGQGDSILIRSPEGKSLLIDAGPTKEGAIRVLRRMGVTHLDLVAISHHHSDHYGGMEEVVRELKPRYFLASSSGHSTRTYLRLLKTVEAEGMTVVHPTSRPRRIELGSVELTIFPQAPEDHQEENNNSVGLRLKYGSFAMLFPGDSEGPERQWWLAHCADLVHGCTILKLAHHGSRNGTDARWLNVVRPELVIASMGIDNEYGHPHAETVRLLRSERIPFLRTDQLGTIVIQSDGRGWSVAEPTALRGRRPRPEDVERVAAATSDGSASRRASRARTR